MEGLGQRDLRDCRLCHHHLRLRGRDCRQHPGPPLPHQGASGTTLIMPSLSRVRAWSSLVGGAVLSEPCLMEGTAWQSVM